MKSLPWRRVLVLGIGGLASIAVVLAWFIGVAPHVSATPSGSSDPESPAWAFISSAQTPPTNSQCNAASPPRRCFNPTSMANSYDYANLHGSGINGAGTTIAIVDSFGSATMTNDLNVFDTQFGVKHLCGEANYTCQAGDPTFSVLTVQGNPPATAQPPNNGTGQENHNLWSGEVSLDVEWAHATAPGANILLVTSPTAETLGVQGLPQFMNAEQYVVDNHLADVITQSFGTAEGAFGSEASLMNLRHAFISAKANNITVLASTGDGGSTNTLKEPVGPPSNANPTVIPYPSANWPATDPLVTAVGGTYLCTDGDTGTSIVSSTPPSRCHSNPGQREVGWIASGGGYSIYFSRPDFQNTLPAGSTYTGTSTGAPGPNSNMRGVPDIAYQASSLSGVLIYDTNPDTKNGSVGCGGASPCNPGWFVIGGTSSGSPQWAGLVAMADQISHNGGHGDIGYMNPLLYQLANSASYSTDFFDVTTGTNNTFGCTPDCYDASPGWDAVTGLGTPDAGKLLPDLVAAAYP